MAEGGKTLIPGRSGGFDFTQIPTSNTKGYLAQLEAMALAPGEKAGDGAGVGAAGVRVIKAGLDELLGDEDGIGAGAGEDGGQGERAGTSAAR